MPAKIPMELVGPSKRYLRDLKVGEECDVTFTAMRVDEQGYGFLDPGEYMAEKESGSTITVKRNVDGYHVTVKRRPLVPFLRKPKWIPFQRWIPIESFTENERGGNGAAK